MTAATVHCDAKLHFYFCFINCIWQGWGAFLYPEANTFLDNIKGPKTRYFLIVTFVEQRTI